MGADAALDSLASLAFNESAISALVDAARLDIADEQAKKHRMIKLREQKRAAKKGGGKKAGSLSPSSEDSAEEGSTSTRSVLLNSDLPFWAELGGANLRLVRTGHSIKSDEVGRLERSAKVKVLERKRTTDGTWRAAISLSESSDDVYGWMTLVTKCGTANAHFLQPQPEQREEGEAILGAEEERLARAIYASAPESEEEQATGGDSLW